MQIMQHPLQQNHNFASLEKGEGKLSDSLGRKWLTVISLGAYLACVAVGGLARTGWVLLVCWGLSGICGGFFISSAFSIIADVTGMKERPKYYGYLATAAAVGMLAGPLLAGVLADAGMARGAYFVGIIGLFALVIYEYRAENPVISVRLFRYREFRVAWICHLLFTMYVVTASAYIVLFSQQVMNVSATVSSTLSMPQTICSAVLSSFVGMFIAKNRKNYRTAYMAMGLCGAVPLLVWAFFLKPDFSVLLIYGMTLLGGIGYACDQVINTPFLQTTMPKESYGAAQGMIAFAGSVLDGTF